MLNPHGHRRSYDDRMQLSPRSSTSIPAPLPALDVPNPFNALLARVRSADAILAYNPDPQALVTAFSDIQDGLLAGQRVLESTGHAAEAAQVSSADLLAALMTRKYDVMAHSQHSLTAQDAFSDRMSLRTIDTAARAGYAALAPAPTA
jgi:hypothetical protein